MQKRWFGLVGLAAVTLLASIASVGCAASKEPGDQDVGSEEEFTSRQLPGVVAVEIARVRGRDEVLSAKTVGAPKKVAKLVSIVKKLAPNERVPKCMERETTRLTFLDGSAKKIATVDTYCSGFGSIAFESGREGFAVKFNEQDADATRDAAFAVGDALWGVGSISVSRPGREEIARMMTGAEAKAVLDGIDMDQVPNPNVPRARCLPSHQIFFFRNDTTVAHASFLCDSLNESDPPSSIVAEFLAHDTTSKDPNAPALAIGGINLDPRPILRGR